MALDFVSRWTAVAWFAVFGVLDGPKWNGIRQTELSRVDSTLLQHLAQSVAGRSDEGLALRSFHSARCFAHEV